MDILIIPQLNVFNPNTLLRRRENVPGLFRLGGVKGHFLARLRGAFRRNVRPFVALIGN